MHSRSRALGSIMLLQVSLLAFQAHGAPVLDEAAPFTLTTPENLPPEAPVLSPLEVTTSGDAPQPIASSAKRPNPALAAIPKAAPSRPSDEARGAATHPGRADVPTPRPPGPGEATPADLSVYNDLDPDLKEAAKTARQWVHEAGQLVSPSRAASGSKSDQAFESEVWSASDEVVGTGPDWKMRSRSGPDAEHPSTSRQAFQFDPTNSGESNLLRDGIRSVRDTVRHPVTWLLMSLVVLGSLMALMMRRRPRQPGRTRQLRERAPRGRRRS